MTSSTPSPTPACTVFLVRHGETIWHEENRYAGSTDVELTERGVQQGLDLAVWAKNAGLDRIVTSDLSRAIITAGPSASATGLEPDVDHRLREVDFGDGEGITRAEMSGIFPDELDSWLAAPAERSLPNGESGNAAITRALEALNEIVLANPGGRILVVVHSTLVRLLCCDLLGIDPNRYRDLFPGLENGALNEFRLVPEQNGAGLTAALISMNVPTEQPRG